MKLSLKIAALIGLGATLLVLVISLLSLRRDLDLVEQDIARDARLVATSIAVVAEDLPTQELSRRMARIEASNDGIHVHYEATPAIAELVWEPDAVIATVPFVGGSIRVVESLDPRDRLLADSLRRLGFTVVFVMLSSLGGGLWVGRLIVGRRVDALVRKARRVARGQLDEPVEVQGADELTLLATELNLMAGQLKSARERSALDAEARLEAEVQLRHADRLRAVGQLSAGMAHELGTPLNVIAGRASLLLRALEHDSPEAEHASTIRVQAQRITGIVRRLMDYSRRAPSKREPTDLQELVEETITLLRPTLAAKRITLSLDVAGSVTVAGDTEQLSQVLTNLVQNAAQAVGHNGRVEVRLEQRGRAVELIVDDDGPGVPVELRERVMEPFYTSKQPGEGTGLGLSVVEGIVKNHGGSLVVGSSELGGARFLVRLPLEAE